MKKIRYKIGDVFEIPLPNNHFAYGRVYEDAGVGIYDFVSDTPQNPPIGSREFMFHVGMYTDILHYGEWKIIGRDPFLASESAWPPPSFIKDVIDGSYSIYYLGEIKPATESECKGLEEAAVWDSHHIIDRIIKNIKTKQK